MKEVALAAGVSVATVSHVLRGSKRVTPAVEARVREEAARLGYLPNLQASALRTGRSDMIGVLLPDLSNPFFPALLNALEVAARAAGLLLLVHETENDAALERRALDRLASVRVDGLVWVPVDGSALADAQAAEPRPGLPMVTLDRPVPGCDAVHADHVEGGRLLARHLRALGHERVALLHGPDDLPSARARRRGFLDAFAPALPMWQCDAGFTHELPVDARRLLAAGGFDALVCANDAVAIGAVRQLRQAGACVPQDVSVVGFDDIPWAPLMDPPLTTVAQPLRAIGAAAVRLLLERIADPRRATRQVVMPVELVVRASTAPRAGTLDHRREVGHS